MVWDLDKVNAVEHLIDFFVIAAADLAAAGIAYRWFESKQTERTRESALEALGRLSPIYKQAEAWATRHLRELDRQPAYQISVDLEDWIRQLHEVRNDFLIWDFRGSSGLRSITNKVYKTYNAVTAGSRDKNSRESLEKLRDAARAGMTEVRSIWSKLGGKE